jgi:hypothetical protein
MDIEDLNKTQLLLLTLLVNFVTAIATAVLTVSLLNEAPPTVTQTVNRIVERTVETAQQTPLPNILPPKETVIIRDEDLLSAAIRADAARRVTIHEGATSSPAVAVGTYLPDRRIVVTASGEALPKEGVIGFSDGSFEEASLARAGATLTVYGFADGAPLPSVTIPDVIPSSSLSQGQTLVSLTSEGAAVSGIISLVSDAGIRANVTGVPPGAAAVNIEGDLIGIATGVPGVFAPAERIDVLLSEAP